jgi:hypothetical protein
MEKIRWTDRVRNEKVLHRVKEDRNMVPAIYSRKANWIGHILRRNCFLKHVTEGRIGVTERRGRRCKHDTGNLKEKHYIAYYSGGSDGSFPGG